MNSLEEIINFTITDGPGLPLKDDVFEHLVMDSEFLGYAMDNPATSGLYYTFLHNIIKYLKPKTIVELGNREGVSTASIISAMTSEQKFYTVDIIDDLRLLPRKFIKQKNITALFGDCLSEKIVNILPDNIDFLFSDTHHTFEQISAEWDVYKKKLSPGAIVAVDDIHYTGSGGTKFKFIKRIKQYKHFISKDLHGTGFLIFKYEK